MKHRAARDQRNCEGVALPRVENFTVDGLFAREFALVTAAELRGADRLSGSAIGGGGG
jgi:hypothetical protein